MSVLPGDHTVPDMSRSMAEQHDEWMAHLRRNVISRRTMVRGAVGAAAGSLLLGSGYTSGNRANAAVIADTGTIAGGFVVNGRHLSFGADPSTQMWAGGQLFNLNKYNAVPPRSVRVWCDYGNVGIISLDANDLSWEIQGLFGYSKGAQVRWLESQLAT